MCVCVCVCVCFVCVCVCVFHAANANSLHFPAMTPNFEYLGRLFQVPRGSVRSLVLVLFLFLSFVLLTNATASAKQLHCVMLV